MEPSRDTGLMSAIGSLADDSLSWVTHAARDTLAGVDWASISVLHGDDHFETIGSTNPLAAKADALQYELGEGPCVDALRGAALASFDDVTAATSWPRYGARVAQLGVRSQAALRLQHDGRTVGSLNLYGTRAGALSEDSLARAESIAARAAQALELSRGVDQLIRSVAARKAIDQAIGLVMGSHDLSRERAFDHLVELSQARNVKLRDVALGLVDQANSAHS